MRIIYIINICIYNTHVIIRGDVSSAYIFWGYSNCSSKTAIHMTVGEKFVNKVGSLK